MAIISDVKTQKKEKRLNIYLNRQFGFGIDRDLWHKKGYQVGQVISDKEVEILKQDDGYTKVWERILHFLTFRPRSQREIRTKLQELSLKFPLSPVVQEKIISKLKELKYLDDAEFGKWWIDERKKRLKGIRLIKKELYDKGLDSELVEELLDQEEFSGLTEATALLTKNRWRFKGDKLRVKNKMQQLLLRHGYDWDEVEKAVENFLTKKG